MVDTPLDYFIYFPPAPAGCTYTVTEFGILYINLTQPDAGVTLEQLGDFDTDKINNAETVRFTGTDLPITIDSSTSALFRFPYGDGMYNGALTLTSPGSSWSPTTLCQKTPTPSPTPKPSPSPSPSPSPTPTPDPDEDEEGDIIVPSRTHPDTAYINLTKETITLPEPVEKYKARTKNWKTGGLPSGEKLSKLFDKGFTLSVVTTSGEEIMFPKINPRPKANAEKLKPFYTDDRWTLRTKDGKEARQKYEWVADANKKSIKSLSSGDWTKLDQEGLAIGPGRKYLFRTPASARVDGPDSIAYIPAGKPFLVKAAPFSKSPKYKLNKDNTIKLRAGDWYQIGTDDPVAVKAALALDITKLPQGTLTVWKGETGKKPRSEKFTFSVGPGTV